MHLSGMNEPQLLRTAEEALTSKVSRRRYPSAEKTSGSAGKNITLAFTSRWLYVLAARSSLKSSDRSLEMIAALAMS